MKYIGLCNRIDQFYKQAFIEAPPRLVDRLFPWIAGCYIGYLHSLFKYNLLSLMQDDSVEDQEDILSVKSILTGFESMYPVVSWKPGETGKVMDELVVVTPDDLVDWRWGHLLADKLNNSGFKLIFKINPEFEMGAGVGSSKPQTRGNFNYQEKKLTIFTQDLEMIIETMPPRGETEEEKNKNLYVKALSSENFIQSNLDLLKTAFQHELAHAMQLYELHSGKDQPTIYGLPPKLKSKYNVRGYPKDKRMPRQIHAFRPIEIYPRLIKSIEDYRKIIPSIPEEERDSFVREFIGADGITENTNINFKDVLEQLDIINSELENLSEEELEGLDPKILNFEERVYQVMAKKFLSEIQKINLIS